MKCREGKGREGKGRGCGEDLLAEFMLAIIFTSKWLVFFLFYIYHNIFIFGRFVHERDIIFFIVKSIILHIFFLCIILKPA